MVLDEPNDSDKVFTESDVTFIIDNDLFEKAHPIKIDFVETWRGAGYSISSNLPLMGGCGTSCSC